MRRTVLITIVMLVGALGFAAGSGSAANPSASCDGVLISSLAGDAGDVAALTRYTIRSPRISGFARVIVDAPGGQLHEGSIKDCLACGWGKPNLARGERWVPGALLARVSCVGLAADVRECSLRRWQRLRPQ